jgi:hypothetical protein
MTMHMLPWTFKVLLVSNIKRPTSKLNDSLAPAAFAISSSGDRLVSQSVKNPKEFGFHSYPSRENGIFPFGAPCYQLELLHSY